MTLYDIEMTFETDEQVERAWLMRDEIVRGLSEDGKAEVVMAVDEDWRVLGLTIPVEAADLVSAGLRGLGLVRRAFSEADLVISVPSIRVTVGSAGISPAEQ